MADFKHVTVLFGLQRVEAVMSGDQLGVAVAEQQQQRQWQEPWGVIPTPHRP